MNKRTIFLTIALTCVWITLTENFSWQNVAIGVILSILTSYFTSAFLPNAERNSEKLKRVKFHRLAIYPFWLIGKVYRDGFGLIKMIIFSNPKCGIVKEQLELDNEVLCAILAESITLTPGTICLELEGKEITLLCMGDEKSLGFPESVNGLRSIERMLQKAEDER